MIGGMIAFAALGVIVGFAYGYGWGYRKGLHKLPDDLTAVIKEKADKIAEKMVQDLKDKMEGEG